MRDNLARLHMQQLAAVQAGHMGEAGRWGAAISWGLSGDGRGYRRWDACQVTCRYFSEADDRQEFSNNKMG